MTIDDLAEKMDTGFKVLGDKLDFVNLTVAKHTVSLSGHDREIKELKDGAKEADKRISSLSEHDHEIKELKDAAKERDRRISRIEIYIWLSLGAGLASGVGVAKFIFN